MLCFYSRKLHRDGSLSIVKAKCTWIICKEVNGAVDDDVAWSSGCVTNFIQSYLHQFFDDSHSLKAS